jgi:hypothetical protein
MLPLTNNVREWDTELSGLNYRIIVVLPFYNVFLIRVTYGERDHYIGLPVPFPLHPIPTPPL